MSRFIEATTKPRLLKHGQSWVCMGMRKNWPWPGRRYVVVTGDTPRSAYEAWRGG